MEQEKEEGLRFTCEFQNSQCQPRNFIPIHQHFCKGYSIGGKRKRGKDILKLTLVLQGVGKFPNIFCGYTTGKLSRSHFLSFPSHSLTLSLPHALTQVLHVRVYVQIAQARVNAMTCVTLLPHTCTPLK